MKPSDLARYYLRFTTPTGPADNAPIPMRKLHNKINVPGLFERCLWCIESNEVLPDPTYGESLKWLAENPDQFMAGDEYLRSKKGKKTESPFRDAVIAAYSAEQLRIFDIVLKTLQTELAD